MNYVGIDNGLNGGLAVLHDTGAILLTARMPVRELGKGRIVDTSVIARWLDQSSPSRVMLESAEKFSPGKMALCSTWDSFGSIRTVLELTMRSFQTIRAAAWQKAMLPGRQKGETKAAAIEAVRRMWPDSLKMLLATERSSVPHQGVIDALLIAEFCRRTWK